MNLKGKILADPVNNWVFKRTVSDVYLVGGYVRDMLRGIISHDKDFVLKNDIEKIAREAALRFNGTFISLREGQVYRIVLPDRSMLDFTRLNETIKDDLFRRDYTINALAWSPQTGLIDVTGGVDDLLKRKIRVIRSENILEDPLRILRAYRLAARLTFDIERDTRRLLKLYAPKIVNASKERITDEIFKLLNANCPHNYIKLCNLDNVLHEVTEMTSGTLGKNMDLIKRFDLNIRKLQLKKSKIYQKKRIVNICNTGVSQFLTVSGFVRLSLLLYGNNQFIPNLKLSNVIRSGIAEMHISMNLAAGRISGNRLYEIFRTCKNSEYTIVLLISLVFNKDLNKYLKRVDEFLYTRNNPLMSGNEIMEYLDISPGHRLGEIKDELMRLQFLGKLKNKSEAKEWIGSNLT